MNHENHAFIEELFFEQAKKITANPLNSFELQFSDAWI
jgi:hypothetical protein